jgi:hypothetical protein
MAFKPVGSLNPHGAPILRKEVITNSVVSTVNDSLRVASGFAALGTAGSLVAGHLVSHKSAKGVGLNSTGAAGAEIGSYVNTFTAASDNQTVAQVAAEMDISKATIYSADPDAAIGTTTGSDLSGYFTDLADEDNTDESTAATTTAQYGILGVDPDDTGNQLVHINESLYWGV